jgi:hypothetical protein
MTTKSNNYFNYFFLLFLVRTTRTDSLAGNYNLKSPKHCTQRSRHPHEVKYAPCYARLYFVLPVLYAVLAVSLVFGSGSAPRTGALCF